jgi:hypothetical protein
MPRFLFVTPLYISAALFIKIYILSQKRRQVRNSRTERARNQGRPSSRCHTGMAEKAKNNKAEQGGMLSGIDLAVTFLSRLTLRVARLALDYLTSV